MPTYDNETWEEQMMFEPEPVGHAPARPARGMGKTALDRIMAERATAERLATDSDSLGIGVRARASRFQEDSKPDSPARQRLAELDEQAAQAGSGRSMSEWAALHTERTQLKHELLVADRGHGLYHSGRKHPPDTQRTDCLRFVLDMLKAGFESVGQGALYKKIVSSSLGLSHKRAHGKFSGVDLVTMLRQAAGWRTVFMIADTDASTSENKEFKHHLQNYQLAKSHRALQSERTAKGVVPGMTIDRVVADYAPEDRGRQNKAELERLRKLPFAVIAAGRGGDHMAMLVNGVVFDTSVDMDADNPDLIRMCTLDEWVYKSAVVVAPEADLQKAFSDDHAG